MKILVTGAAGFIGSWLAETLLKRGDSVVGVDNFNDYYDPGRKRANAGRLAHYPHFKMVEADIRDRQRMFNLFEEEKFEAVGHLAAMAGVRNAVENPLLYVEVDYNATQHLMDAARAHHVGNFVFASTSSVYGNTQQLPFVESDPCDRPLQPYAAAKRAAEMLGYTYHYLFKMNFTAVRFFTVYGPAGRPDMMAYLVAESIHKGSQVTVYENGNMHRDWTFVADIVDGIIKALDKPLGYEILNLGRGEPVLLREFIEVMEELGGRKVNAIHKPMPPADVPYTFADITKARQLIGYNPQVSVQEGVKAFWDWYIAQEK